MSVKCSITLSKNGEIYCRFRLRQTELLYRQYSRAQFLKSLLGTSSIGSATLVTRPWPISRAV
eukprot:UN11723